MTAVLSLFVLLATALALPPGWTEGGTPGAGTPDVLEAASPQTGVPFPKELVAKLDGPTVLFYFSPRCPHCQVVTKEVSALAMRLQKSGTGKLLGIASGVASQGELLEYRATWGADFAIHHDTSREIAAAMGARSTPAALLIKPSGKGKVDVLDLWYPYIPGFDSLIEARLAEDPWSVFRPGEYKSSAFCGTCHGVEYASMQMTHHAIAWRTLVKRKKTDDAACTSCHVTGAGEPGGWSGNPDSRLVGVGCEACHGPGGPHDGIANEPLETCATCHDEKHSLAFSLEAGVPLIDHYKRLAVDEQAFDARMLALWEGKAPRELLKFAEGKNMGAAACLECHAEQHAQWSSSPHATAMVSLRPEGKGGELDCVRCHATAKQSGGPAPTTLSGFRVLEGVSCESCHGPGEAHVEAEGGTDNIERLGDDCPVCVIEAVCTGCHTEKWDPEWNLEQDLPKVGHGGDR